MEHPYPDHAYLERDDETNEKRWFGTKGMGVRYIHEDRAAEDTAAAIAELKRVLSQIEEALTDEIGIQDNPGVNRACKLIEDALAVFEPESVPCHLTENG